MATKKSSPAKKITRGPGRPVPSKAGKRLWRPSRLNPDYTDLSLRVLMTQADLIQSATEAEAKRLNIPVSRNSFCLRAAVAAAEAELALIP